MIFKIAFSATQDEKSFVSETVRIEAKNIDEAFNKLREELAAKGLRVMNARHIPF